MADAGNWSIAAPALGSAFAATLVEVVEAFTIVLAVVMLRGWRCAAAGAVTALGVLAALVALFGPLLDRMPIQPLQLTIGILLLFFGLGWLRKAILRAAGVIPLHDEAATYASQSAQLHGSSDASAVTLAWIGGLTAFKAVLLEGLEVVFIVVAVGAGRGLVRPASLGALAACAVVLAVGAIVRRPLAKVPENTLKFGIGTMLSAFGVLWTGEGLGIAWPGQDAALAAFAALFLAAGLATVTALRRPATEMVR
ncbi:MAG: hypothetical protein WB697_24620 [Stellaceae bacterium]